MYVNVIEDWYEEVSIRVRSLWASEDFTVREVEAQNSVVEIALTPYLFFLVMSNG